MKTQSPDVKHFLAIPWAAAHINAPNTVRETAGSRYPKESTEDELFAKTLHTDGTISAFLAFYTRPPPVVSAASEGEQRRRPQEGQEQQQQDQQLIREVKALLTLNSGVNGFPGVSHGGIVATILDETIGLVFPVNKANGLVSEGDYMTAYLNTTYLRPVRTPQTVLVVVEIIKVEGRKFWIEGRIEDEKGDVLAKAESLYVRLREKL
ncbi:Acyl-coenzyme A thioesterase THEM4 [Colletotrichum trifolii]|uniref:Acyl-coenzyme A thioesterase THEM4 n=1 Tax=Colletotrichum trifolii TaxID=5466 RepID=A0A4V3HVD9_COLTR|nr:Acyl-coenzyme A thioesterase THEM4 [Colletotrichum trifolii]